MISARRGPTALALTGFLAIAALITTGYWARCGLEIWDVEAMESPLMMSVARQLIDGPGGLYGPFDNKNHLVLIHAPLYYRTAAILSRSLLRAGISPTEAARIGGRGLSAMCFLIALIVAYRLARLHGGSKLAGWWAVLLLMSSPLLAGLPFAVRPDMLGVALQSIGLLLVLSSLEVGAGSKVKLAFGYAAFGLGLCVKQHLVFEMAVCSGLLISNRRSARISNFTIASSFAACVAVVATVYAVEWVVTGGEIWRSAFVAASRVGRIYPGDLGNVDIFVYGLIRRDSGYLALLALLCLTPLGFAQGVFRKSALIVGAAAFSIPSLNFAAWGSWKTNTLEVTNHFVGLSACIVFLACCIRGRRLLLGNRLDAVLWTCLAGEVSLVLLMAYLSTGTWFNYAIQAAVLGSVIVARIADRVIDALPSPWAAWPITLGLLAITLASYDHIADADAERRNDRMSVEKIWETLELPRDSVFFADYPGANRIGGRLDLVYDHWLYRVFESAHLATSRSSWLHHVLQTKTLRSVVTLDEQMILEGTGIPLRNYAFRPSIRVGRFYVWVR